MSDAPPFFVSYIKISLLPSNCDILKILLVSFKSSKIEGEDLMIDSDSVMGQESVMIETGTSRRCSG